MQKYTLLGLLLGLLLLTQLTTALFPTADWVNYEKMCWETAEKMKSDSNSSQLVDVATLLSVDNWKCFHTHAAAAAPRAYRSVGSVDANFAQNVHNMQSAGYTVANSHAYFFPCVKNCPNKSMATQFNEVWTEFSTKKLAITMLFLDIEGANLWYADKFTNQLRFEQLIQAAKAKNAAIGIYTSKNNWSEIFGLDYKPSISYPLWYAHYDKLEKCTDFVPFGPFSKALLKQYGGDLTDKCGGIDHDMSVYC